MIQSLILSLGLSFAIGVSGVKDNNHNFVNNDNPINVVYDDVNYSITLSADELNNYTWDNLSLIINDDIASYATSSFYGTYEGVSSGNSFIYLVSGTPTYYASFNYNALTSESLNDNKFTINNTSESISFEYDIKYVFSSVNYNNIKSAIELDIDANSSTTPTLSDFQSILNAIISLLVGGITGMANGLGSGINASITALAVENGSMSIFLGVVAIFGGIALAVGLTRRIFAWIQSLGGRN